MLYQTLWFYRKKPIPYPPSYNNRYEGAEFYVRKSYDLGDTWTAYSRTEPLGAGILISLLSGGVKFQQFADGWIIGPLGSSTIDSNGIEIYLDFTVGTYVLTKDFETFEIIDTSLNTNSTYLAPLSIWNDEIRITGVTPIGYGYGYDTATNITTYVAFAKKGVALTAHANITMSAEATTIALCSAILSAGPNILFNNVEPCVCVCNPAWTVALNMFTTLTGAGAGSTTVLGAINTQLQLNAALNNELATSASLNAAIALTASSTVSIASTLVEITENITLQTATTCTVSNSGAITASIRLLSPTTTATTVSATLTTQVQNAAVAVNVAVVTAALTSAIALAATTSQNSAAVVDILHMQSGLQATALCASSSAPNVSSSTNLSGLAVVTNGIISAILSAFVVVPIGVIGDKPIKRQPNTAFIFTKNTPVRKVG
jgi:hypothetical protein